MVMRARRDGSLRHRPPPPRRALREYAGLWFRRRHRKCPCGRPPRAPAPGTAMAHCRSQVPWRTTGHRSPGGDGPEFPRTDRELRLGEEPPRGGRVASAHSSADWRLSCSRVKTHHPRRSIRQRQARARRAPQTPRNQSQMRFGGPRRSQRNRAAGRGRSDGWSPGGGSGSPAARSSACTRDLSTSPLRSSRTE